MKAPPVPIRIAIILVLVLTGAGLWWRTRREGATRPGLEASGTVEATQAGLGFQLPGRVAWVGPREGDSVAARDELARLEQAELSARLEAAVAQLAATEARLQEMLRGSRPEEIAGAEAAVEAAGLREAEVRREAERARRLYEGGAASRQSLEQAETALAVASTARVQAEQALAIARQGPRTEAVSAQRALVDQARANRAQVVAALEQSVIRAPFSGRISVRHREPGEAVGAGAPILTLLDLSDRWVRIYVPENQMGHVALGQQAEVRASTYPERRYRGEVVFIGDVAEFTPRNVQTPEERTRLVYPVKVRILGDAELDLKPGIPADVLLPEARTGSASGPTRPADVGP